MTVAFRFKEHASRREIFDPWRRHLLSESQNFWPVLSHRMSFPPNQSHNGAILFTERDSHRRDRQIFHILSSDQFVKSWHSTTSVPIATMSTTSEENLGFDSEISENEIDMVRLVLKLKGASN
ncbi:hypothetical protein Pdw03_1058 [Penicillium digitatum]|nr:hypothetical protein Pdw03_1058 [Penicillium digitatum]